MYGRPFLEHLVILTDLITITISKVMCIQETKYTFPSTLPFQQCYCTILFTYNCSTVRYDVHTCLNAVYL
jgi:hypothetical protein